MNPQGVTLTYKGDILVTDSNNQCVQVGEGRPGREGEDGEDIICCMAAPIRGLSVSIWCRSGNCGGEEEEEEEVVLCVSD